MPNAVGVCAEVLLCWHRCCTDAIAFTNKGCSCNSMFAGYVAPQQGFTAKTLAVCESPVALHCLQRRWAWSLLEGRISAVLMMLRLPSLLSLLKLEQDPFARLVCLSSLSPHLV